MGQSLTTIRTERPGFSVSSVPFVATNTSFYNSLGQLIRTTSPGQADTLYAYDSLGAQTRSGLDVNGNGTLDLSGPDRVSESHAWYEFGDPGLPSRSLGEGWWQVSASILYPLDGSAAPVTNAIQRTRLTGLGVNSEFGIQNSEFISQDLLGNQTISRTFIDRDHAVRVGLVSTPDSTNAAISVTINGLAQYSISKTGVRTDYAYDALARQISARVDAASPPRSVGSFTHYNTLGQVDYVEDAASNRTTFAYCPTTGRRISVTDALSNTTYTAYDPEGRVIATWGATYPVAYAYDAYGRMVVMATFRVEGGAGDQTQWRYDEATGLLTNKVYADGKGPSYTYTPQGQLATRTWARGVTTTYAYATDGAMTNIIYSDGTPSVSFTLDRLGRQRTITDATGSRSFAYNDAMQLAAETNAMGTITRHYDSFGRSSGLAVGADYQVGYGYLNDGRFASVTSSVQSVSSVVNYSYLPNSDLISGWSNGILSTVRSYEPNRDLITAVENQSGASLISRFDYANDAIARRTQRIDSGSATATNQFGYNPRSELTSAAMGTNAYGYTYDPIGNRTAATNNAEVLTYFANALNQYTNILCAPAPLREDLPRFDLDGNLTNYNGWAFTWDAENRLISATSASLAVQFSYDYMSRRYQIIVGTTTNTFLYDGWNLVSETIANPQSTITNSYVWGLDLSGSLQGAGGIGGLLSVTLSGAGVPPATYYPCADANGNITDYLDTNGTIVAHREFDAFGNTTVATGSMVNDFNFWFSTKYLDQETGLYYYGYRDFAPGMGRWLSRDPIEESGGVNIYQFVGNSALTWVDPVGLEWSDPERVGGIRARTTCEACDTVRELAEKVHLDAEEYLKWLQTEPPGGEMPSSADQPIVTSRTFTVPNRVYITYGNMRAAYAAGTLIGDPTDLSFYNKFLTRASGMESTFTSKGYRVTNFMGKLGIGGNPIGVHQGVLGKADIAVWGFFGHGKTPNGIFIGDTGAPGGPGVSGFSTAYNPAAFRGAQRYRLSEVVMFSCFQGSYALLPGWLDLVAKGGNLVASHLPVGIGWSGWTWFYNNPIFQHPKP